jgi:hypothetical protein
LWKRCCSCPRGCGAPPQTWNVAKRPRRHRETRGLKPRAAANWVRGVGRKPAPVWWEVVSTRGSIGLGGAKSTELSRCDDEESHSSVSLGGVIRETGSPSEPIARWGSVAPDGALGPPEAN